MYYHASPTPGIRVLEPRVSNHNTPLVYFSKKRENTLVYLSNAIEKFCTETGYIHSGKWTKWGPYGFKSGILQLDEYYPNALEDTYRGVSGYVYHAHSIQEAERDIKIPDAAVSTVPVAVDGAEFISDACEAILEAERRGLILVRRYGNLPEQMLTWIRKTMQEQYDSAGDQPEYRYFFKHKFDFVH